MRHLRINLINDIYYYRKISVISEKDKRELQEHSNLHVQSMSGNTLSITDEDIETYIDEKPEHEYIRGFRQLVEESRFAREIGESDQNMGNET